MATKARFDFGFWRRAWLAATLVLFLALSVSAAWAGQELQSWRGPARQILLDYIQAVTTPGGPDFIPPEHRNAAFDVDGTLMGEKPVFLPMALSCQRLGRLCPQAGQAAPKGLESLCAMRARGGCQAVEKGLIDQALTTPFVGLEFAEYEQMAGQFMERGVNPANGKPYRQLVYPPMIELVELLRQKGFTVWACSGSPTFFLRAIGPKYLHVDPDNCIGTVYQATPVETGGKLGFRRGAGVESLNLDMQKAINLLQRLGEPPVLAFGNSGGDRQMLRFALSGRWRGLALLLEHDDPREFVYGRPDLGRELARDGVVLVSMRQSFVQVYAEP